MTQTGITNDSTFCISNTCFVHVHPLHVHIQYICFAYPSLSLKRSNSFLLILCVGFKVVVVLSGYINDCLKEKRSIKVRPCDYLVRTAWLGPRIKIWLLREIWEGWGQGGGIKISYYLLCFGGLSHSKLQQHHLRPAPNSISSLLTTFSPLSDFTQNFFLLFYFFMRDW